MELPVLNQVEDYSCLTNGQGKIVKDPKAFCTSIRCFDSDRNAKLGTRKDVIKTTINCPDCGSALYWFWGQRNGMF